MHRHAPPHKPNLNKRQCNANQTVRWQRDHSNVEHIFFKIARSCPRFWEKSAVLIANFRSGQCFFLYMLVWGWLAQKVWRQMLNLVHGILTTASCWILRIWKSRVSPVTPYTSSDISIHVNQSIRTLRWKGTRGWTRTKELWRSLSRQSTPITWNARTRTRKAFLFIRSHWSCWIWAELTLRRTRRMRRLGASTWSGMHSVFNHCTVDTRIDTGFRGVSMSLSLAWKTRSLASWQMSFYEKDRRGTKERDHKLQGLGRPLLDPFRIFTTRGVARLFLSRRNRDADTWRRTFFGVFFREPMSTTLNNSWRCGGVENIFQNTHSWPSGVRFCPLCVFFQTRPLWTKKKHFIKCHPEVSAMQKSCAPGGSRHLHIFSVWFLHDWLRAPSNPPAQHFSTVSVHQKLSQHPLWGFPGTPQDPGHGFFPKSKIKVGFALIMFFVFFSLSDVLLVQSLCSWHAHWLFVHFTSCFHSVRVLEKGLSHDTQHLSGQNSSTKQKGPIPGGFDQNKSRVCVCMQEARRGGICCKCSGYSVFWLVDIFVKRCDPHERLVKNLENEETV